MIAALAAAAVLAGCGQRGPLYLPDSQPKKKMAITVSRTIAFRAIAPRTIDMAPTIQARQTPSPHMRG
ncbi:MAG: hypothetical protein ABT05_07650 [Lautropia sp. SCN 66-9]|nr:MAG: hypothetical protein ABT05_07650 [Lautropia sp. SCN 66-9]